MIIRIARYAFVLIALVAIVSAVFRVSTAPDRIKQQRDTAYSVCIASGGEWVKVDRDEICVKEEAAKKP